MITPTQFYDDAGFNSGIISFDNTFVGVVHGLGHAHLADIEEGHANNVANVLCHAKPLVSPYLRRKHVLLFNNIDLDWLDDIPPYILREIGERTVNVVCFEPFVRTTYGGTEEELLIRRIRKGDPFSILTKPDPPHEVEIIRAWATRTGKTVRIFSCEAEVPGTVFHDGFLYCAHALACNAHELAYGHVMADEMQNFTNLRYKMGSFNGRWRLHRSMLVTALKGCDPGSDALVTWMNPVDKFDTINLRDPDIKTLLQRGSERMRQTSDPLAFSVHELPEDTPDWTAITTGHGNASKAHFFAAGVLQNYPRCATILVNETNFFTGRPNISEKTFYALITMRPFLLAAPAGSLALLRDMGFETFPELFDERYDEVSDHEERLSIIIANIQRIMSMPRAKLRARLVSMKDKLMHNYLRIRDDFPHLQSEAFEVLLEQNL